MGTEVKIARSAPIRGFEAKTLPPPMANLFAYLIMTLTNMNLRQARQLELGEGLQAILSEDGDCVTLVKERGASGWRDAMVALWPIGERVVMSVYSPEVAQHPDAYAKLLNSAVSATSGI